MSDISALTSQSSTPGVTSGDVALAGLKTAVGNLNTDKVEGQSSSVDSEVAIFSGTGGKTIKRASVSGFAKLLSGVLSAVASIVEADFGFTDVSTANASTSAHGLLKKLSNIATNFMNGAGNWADVKDSDLATTDITTNNASSSKHGFLLKLTNTGTKYLRDDGTWQTVAPLAMQSPTAATVDGNGHQVTRDSLLFGFIALGSTDGEKIIYIDSNSTPTTKVGSFLLTIAAGGTNTLGSSFCFPIKANDYYKITTPGSCTAYLMALTP